MSQSKKKEKKWVKKNMGETWENKWAAMQPLNGDMALFKYQTWHGKKNGPCPMSWDRHGMDF